MTDLRQAAQQALDALERYQVKRQDFDRFADEIAALRTALAMHQVSDFAQAQEQQVEPSQWRDMVVVSLVREGVNKHKARELADHFAAPPQRQLDKTSFNDWWDGDYDDSENRFEQDSAAYWAWAGWEAAQRPWVGLTDEDFLEACQIAERGNYLLALQRIQIKLKERNT